ncbi:hypothetical protein Pmani_020504 [Petrolisthes manimaculis]|uniref:Uncharacterized protein n=1 Tax=Petrolisthes manimaculis TaxID=1843537 RepID=A0AAE1PHK1_9EUCA|nr:hypothetical protein Pmani_020504 [Petrolisthes manimaculis]
MGLLYQQPSVQVRRCSVWQQRRWWLSRSPDGEMSVNPAGVRARPRRTIVRSSPLSRKGQELPYKVKS